MTKELDTEHQPTIICPYCGYHYKEPYEISLDDEGGEHECDECLKNFGWTIYQEIKYSTYKK